MQEGVIMRSFFSALPEHGWGLGLCMPGSLFVASRDSHALQRLKTNIPSPGTDESPKAE